MVEERLRRAKVYRKVVRISRSTLRDAPSSSDRQMYRMPAIMTAERPSGKPNVDSIDVPTFKASIAFAINIGK